MGKLIISTHITLDGVIGPSPSDWASLEGERAFHGRQVRLQPIATTTFDSGITLLCYRPAPDQQATPET
jgi:hypothetical protein